MAYNTVAIKKDVDGKPIPQVYNPISNQYEVLEGLKGASKTILYDENGNKIDLTTLLDDIYQVLDERVNTHLYNIFTTLTELHNKDNTKTFYGLSTETKPTSGNVKGNKYFEINTGEVFMWNGTSWVVI